MEYTIILDFRTKINEIQVDLPILIRNILHAKLYHQLRQTHENFRQIYSFYKISYSTRKFERVESKHDNQ